MPKICTLCGSDCSDRPRIKDPRGRYFCRACYDRSLERQHAAHEEEAELAAAVPPSPAPAPPRRRRRLTWRAPAWAVGVAMLLATGAAFAFGNLVTGLFVAFVAVVTVNGYWIGGMRIAAILAGLVAAAIVGIPLGRVLEGLFGAVVGSSGLTNRIISITVVSIATMIAVAVGVHVLLLSLKERLPGWTRNDRAIGAGLGFAEGGLLGFLMLWSVFSLEPMAVTSLSHDDEGGGNPISQGVVAMAEAARESVVGRVADTLNPLDEMRLFALFENALIVLNDPGAREAFVTHPAVERLRNLPSVQAALQTLSDDPEIGLILETGAVNGDQLRRLLDSDTLLAVIDDGGVVADVKPMIGDVQDALDEALTRQGMDPALVVAAPFIDELVAGYRDDLASGKARQRLEAAQALGSIGPAAAAAVPELIHALGDLNEHVRFAAVDALARIGPVAAEAVPALEAIIAGPDEQLARDARFAVRAIRMPVEESP